MTRVKRVAVFPVSVGFRIAERRKDLSNPRHMKTRPLTLLAASAVLAMGITMANAGISIELVSVGNAGNVADGSGYGAVSNDYAIGKYEVTIGQYTSFLNAVAATDTYGLYNTNMGTDLNVAGIARSGSSGSYTYSVMNNAGSSANRPITYVSWFDAVRFSNWMANGQPTGTQIGTTTENGAYTLNGATSGMGFTKNTTNPNTAAAVNWWIPSENEWYKAAYYDASLNSGTGGYWQYPTQSNTAPGNTIGSGANNANIYVANFFATGVAPYLTDVGAFSGSASHYGTYDQGGNVQEWNDDVATAYSRGLRGGDWSYVYGLLGSSIRGGSDPTHEESALGFRVASVPEPSTAGLLLLAGAGWLVWKRRKVTLG
jgi:formylglycine-generating enzyme required for sulfatase activity